MSSVSSQSVIAQFCSDLGISLNEEPMLIRWVKTIVQKIGVSKSWAGLSVVEIEISDERYIRKPPGLICPYRAYGRDFSGNLVELAYVGQGGAVIGGKEYPFFKSNSGRYNAHTQIKDGGEAYFFVSESVAGVWQSAVLECVIHQLAEDGYPMMDDRMFDAVYQGLAYYWAQNQKRRKPSRVPANHVEQEKRSFETAAAAARSAVKPYSMQALEAEARRMWVNSPIRSPRPLMV